jgi:aerobic C4-dicarboxylate transport protein
MLVPANKTADPQLSRGPHRHLYVQVLIAIVAGVLIGHFFPATGEALKPVGDAFIKTIKMVIAPLIFLTVTVGIGRMHELDAFGRLAGKALIYFLTFSTLALFIGLAVASIVQPGAGMNVDPAQLDAGAISQFADQAHEQSITGFVLSLIPSTMLSAMVEGNILQVLFVAILCGVAISMIGAPATPLVDMLDNISQVVFQVIGLIMRVAPLGAFGAMAFTIGKFGIGSLVSLAALVGCFYLTAFLFIVIVLGAVARYNGFSLWRLIRYLRTELVLVLGTSSSEAALPSLMQKMEMAGCRKQVVGLVVPMGYSFNLDGTNIYMALAALFVAQACNIDLGWQQQALLLGVAILSSKGAAGVTGAGFITLAATLAVVPDVPLAGLALILGIDRFMSECRSITNFIGNAVATIVVARWDNALDNEALHSALSGVGVPAVPVPAVGEIGQAHVD